VSVACPAFYLLRPDGHVGLAGTHFDEDAVTDWLARNHLHLARAIAGQHVRLIDNAVGGGAAVL
jgi:hypothetical protein